MATKTNLSFYSLFLFLFLPTILAGQSKNDKTVVGTVGDQKVTFAELKQNYSLGSTSEITLEGLESFLPIYLDYKAKLLSAKDEGYYEDSALVEEHKSYAKQAAYAFWLEKEIKQSAFDEFYKRSEVELKPYHILISIRRNASQQEINTVVEKLNQAKEEIENGTPLDEVNKKYSSTRGGRSMGGDIPWISAGRTVQEFEDVVYGLEVGEISEPFRTQFGYHIVLLQNKRERTPNRLANHIFVSGTGDSASYDKIYEAYGLLEEGTSWNEVLKQYSEDGASVRNNGRIGWVSYQGNFAMDFVDAVVNVDPELPYSEPVKTNYGYHILKIDSVETYKSEQDRRDALMKKLKDTPYYEESNQFAISYLKEKFNAQGFNGPVEEYKEWVTQFDSISIAELSAPPSLSEQKVYEFNGKDYLVGDYHKYVKNNYANQAAANYRDNWFNSFTDYIFEANIINLTIENYPEFKEQSEGYLNGLVVYNINDQNIWNSATVDTSRLKSIYEDNMEDYQFPERPFYYLLTARHDSTLDKAVAFIESGGSPDSLRQNVNQLGVSSDSTTGFTQEPFDRLEDMESKSFSEKFEYNNLRAIFWLEDRLPARSMTFEEAFNRVLAAFQPQREQEWTEELRDKYNVKANYKKLRKAFQKDS